LTKSRSAQKLEIGQFSDPGRRRQNNEDWLGTFQPPDPARGQRKGSLFLVADGMGGHQSGELASRYAVDRIIRHYMRDPSTDVASSLREAIETANATLHAREATSENGGKWGTTVVAAVVRDSRLWIANVGDSRACLIRDGQLRQLSRDHDLASELGVNPSARWIGRHMVTRALGQKPEVDVDVFPPLGLRTGDRILLCTDGLTNPLSGKEIGEIATALPPQAAAVALVKAANERGGPDNVSVILIRVDGLDRHAVVELVASLARRETWQRAAKGLKQLAAGKELDWRSPAFLGVLLLSALVLALAGFALGWVLFRLF
jgi:serine/threonine protein phosphatase PrpC